MRAPALVAMLAPALGAVRARPHADEEAATGSLECGPAAGPEEASMSVAGSGLLGSWPPWLYPRELGNMFWSTVGTTSSSRGSSQENEWISSTRE
jgi:hypothetical protein